MIKVNLAWVAKQVNGTLSTNSVDQLPVNDVCTDTRKLKSNDLFIALIGDNFDGHDYTLQALKKGACALLASKPVNTPLPVIRVADTRVALGQLAAAVKGEVSPKTIGITGSSGKTTVKEMCASILSQVGNTLSTKGNLNNDIGVPLTLLELNSEHQFAVIEMGANHQGEIAYTTQLVKPDVATIINAAPSHLEGFGSLFGVARAKNEIFAGLETGGKAVINIDSQFFEYWSGKNSHYELITFSPESQKGDFYASNKSINHHGCAEFELSTPQGKVPVRLSVPGAHNAGNAVLAAALTSQLGATLEHIQAGLFNMQSVQGRLTVVQLATDARLLDDTYNANVASTKAAIDSLCTFAGMRVFVFGDMGELGGQSAQYHQEIGIYAKQNQVDVIISMGNLSRNASEMMNENGAHLDDIEQVVSELEKLYAAAQEEDNPINILIKGSRSARMERVSQALKHSACFSISSEAKPPC